MAFQIVLNPFTGKLEYVSNAASLVDSVGAGTGLSSSGGANPVISIGLGYYLPTNTDEINWNSKSNQAISPTNGDIATVDGAGNVTDSGKIFDTDGTFASDSDTHIATQKAILTYLANNYVADSSISDSGVTISTDGTFASDSDSLVPTEKAVRTYSDTKVLGPGTVVSGDIVTFNGTTGLAIQDSGKIVPSGTIVGTTDTQTLTNKRNTRRVNTVASSATPSINTDTTDLFTITALATAITNMSTNLTGTPVNGDLLEIRILDNGSPQTISWGTSFASTGGTTLPTTTVASTTLRILVEWNSASSKFECIGTT